jgi:hypothetical protein
MRMKPPSMRRRSPYSFGILAVVFSAAAFFVSTGLGQLWPLTWIAPVPVLIVAFRGSWQRAALIAFGAFFLGCGTLVSAYGPGAWLIFGFPAALGFAAATVAARFAADRLGWLAILAFPAVLTAYEFLFSLISPNGTLWSVGYSQTDFLPVLQLVALTGLWGVVFILGLVPSAAALAWLRRSATLLVPALIIVVPVLGYGSWRLRSTAEASGVRVGLAATDRGLPDASITADTSAKTLISPPGRASTGGVAFAFWRCPHGTSWRTRACIPAWRSSGASRMDSPSLGRPRKASSRSAIRMGAFWANKPAQPIRLSLWAPRRASDRPSTFGLETGSGGRTYC